jgi:hypothetical protein
VPPHRDDIASQRCLSEQLRHHQLKNKNKGRNMMKRRHFLVGLGAALAAPAVLRAAPEQGLKLGVLTDMTGIFSDGTGKGSVTGAQASGSAHRVI